MLSPKSSHGKKEKMPASQTPNTGASSAHLKQRADRLIALLGASAMPEEVKSAWLALLPKMTPEQCERLSALLEDELNQTIKAMKTQPENEELVVKLKAAKERYDAKLAAADKKVLDALDKIEQGLPT